MYEPHEAREDTVLFPALHGIMTAAQYDDLGEAFEATKFLAKREGPIDQFLQVGNRLGKPRDR
jgi:hypothetical protein